MQPETIKQIIMKKLNFVTEGVMSINNAGGIEVMLNEDMIIYRYCGKLARRWQKIKYTASGRTFFRIKGQRYYLDQFMRN